MKCPNCRDTALVMSDRQGVEIDYCPDCRGVWLDRGELDKLLERAATAAPVRHHATPARLDFVDSDYPRAGTSYPRRKKSWLSELLD
jgi:uncharacterized protein